MPVQFLTPEQRASYGRYAGEPQEDELARYFYLDDADRKMIRSKRGDHNRLGFALQLTTVRFLGTFLADPFDVPESVLRTLTRQLSIEFSTEGWPHYQEGEQKWEHVSEIKEHYGFGDWDDPRTGFRLIRWLHALCWTGTERPGVLFDRATSWLLAHKVILPGCSTLERCVSRLRHRVEERLWKKIGQGISKTQRSHLEQLLTVPEGRNSQLDTLRTGPVRVSGPSLVKALHRLREVRNLGIEFPSLGVPPARIASLSRFAEKAKVTAISRLSSEHRLATLASFVHRLEATAQDDAVEVLEMLLTKIFNEA